MTPNQALWKKATSPALLKQCAKAALHLLQNLALLKE